MSDIKVAGFTIVPPDGYRLLTRDEAKERWWDQKLDGLPIFTAVPDGDPKSDVVFLPPVSVHELAFPLGYDPLDPALDPPEGDTGQ